jgi:ATP-dependent helicase/nuclease subunit B
MGRILLFTGPDRSDRAARIDALLREEAGAALLLTPAYAYASARREELLLGASLPGAWGNPVREFNDFARYLLEAEGREVRLLGDFERLLILEGCLGGMEASGGLSLFHAEAQPDTAAGMTPGLARHLLRVITQLKQAAIEPEDFQGRVERAGAAPIDQAVAQVYAAYQDALKATGHYDVPGLYWEAERHCLGAAPKALHGIRLLALDGFDDFTPSQFRLIQALSRQVDRLVFGLNLDPAPDRADLYARSIETAQQIRQRFEVLETNAGLTPPKRYSDFAATTVFWRDPPRAIEGLTPDLEIHTHADVLHEIESIARKIKRLILDEGVAPERIAVVFRDFDGIAATLRAVFREFGLPCRIHHKQALRQSALGAFLRRLIEAGAAWRREAVLDVLLSPWGAGASPIPLAAPLLARMARIVGGIEEWRNRLGSLRARVENGTGEEIEELIGRLPEAALMIDDLQQRIERLWDLWHEWPDSATQRNYVELFARILKELGVEETAAQRLNPEIADSEQVALDALYDLLRTLTEFEGDTPLSREAFLERLEIGLRETTYLVTGGRGGVFCGNPAAVRNLAFDHVFFGGLIEGVIPAPPPANAVYADQDRDRLRQAGIVIEGRREHNARERLLFHHVLSVARQGLYLSWRVHKDAGGEATPSAFLTEVQSIFSGWADIEAPAPRADSFVPGPCGLGSLRDLRNAAFHHAPALLEAFPDACAAAVHGAAIEQCRQNNEPFGPYDGMLDDPALVGEIATRFGEAHIFSVNQIEGYLACPFRFFTERILGVRETKVPSAEFDPRRYGAILHRALENFHQQQLGKAIPEIAFEEAQETARHAVADAFKTMSRAEITAPPGLVAAEEGRMNTQIDRYLHIEHEGKDQWKPMHFEVAFGPVKGPKDDPLTTPDPFVLETPEGPIRFSGRIDRIDRDGASARIIDYKSGSAPSSGEIKQGLSLQLTLYAWVLDRVLFEDVGCEEAWFISVGNKKSSRNALNLKGVDREELDQNANAAIVRALRGIRAAQFPPVPATENTCNYCPFQAACRYSKRRIERKAPASDGGENEDNGDED